MVISIRLSVYNYLSTWGIFLLTEISTLLSVVEVDGMSASISLEEAEEDFPTSHGDPTVASLLLSMSSF